MTTIQILRQEYKLLLENYEIINDCDFYRDCRLGLLFRDQEFKSFKVTLGKLLNLWMNSETNINNEKNYVVSARLGPDKISGLGINIETEIMNAGTLTFNNQKNKDVFIAILNSTQIQNFYVPLNFIIVELQSGRNEYIKTVEEVNNTFIPQLSREAESQGLVLANKIRLDQEQEKFIITITVPLLLKQMMEKQTDDRDRMKVISSFREHTKYNLGKFGFEDISFSSDQCSIKKAFLHPSDLLKEETLKDLIVALSTFENAIKAITNNW